jgi:hypothetical protein
VGLHRGVSLPRVLRPRSGRHTLSPGREPRGTRRPIWTSPRSGRHMPVGRARVGLYVGRLPHSGHTAPFASPVRS